MQLLRDCRGMVLWRLEAAPGTGANRRREAARHGIDGARLVFARYAETSAHLHRQCHADLFLDTFHYNAHTTASDALWAGLPVLTRLGAAFPGRVAETGRAHVRTPVPNAHIVCRLLLEKKKQIKNTNQI